MTPQQQIINEHNRKRHKALGEWGTTLGKVATENPKYVVISIGCANNEQQCFPNFVKGKAKEKKLFLVNIDPALTVSGESQDSCLHAIKAPFFFGPHFLESNSPEENEREEQRWFKPLQKILDDGKKLVIMFNSDGLLTRSSTKFVLENKHRIGKDLTIILSHEDPEPSLIINKAFIEDFGKDDWSYPLHETIFYGKSLEELMESPSAHQLKEFSAKYGKILPLDQIELEDLIDQIKTATPFAQEFFNKIKLLEDKKVKLKSDLNAYHAADTLCINLRKEGEIYFNNPQTKESYALFKDKCERHISKAHCVLDKHREVGKIIVNILAIILSGGIGYLIAAGVNMLANNGKFTLFSTDSCLKINDVERSVIRAAVL